MLPKFSILKAEFVKIECYLHKKIGLEHGNDFIQIVRCFDLIFGNF